MPEEVIEEDGEEEETEEDLVEYPEEPEEDPTETPESIFIETEMTDESDETSETEMIDEIETIDEEIATESEVEEIEIVDEEIATESEIEEAIDEIASISELSLSLSPTPVGSESVVTEPLFGVGGISGIYYKLSSDGKTIYFAGSKLSGYDQYDNQDIGMAPPNSILNRQRAKITKVVFDTDMFPANLQTNATNNRGFFREMTNIETIEGLEHIKWDGNSSHLNTYKDLFYGLEKLTSVDIEDLDFSNCASVQGMFEGCTSLTYANLSGADWSKVTNVSNLFKGCTGLTTIDLTGLNWSAATSISGLFSGCTNMTSVNMSNINLSNCTDMSALFSGMTKLETFNFSGAIIPNVTNISQLFYNCSNITNISFANLDFSKVTNVSNMFYGCTNLTSVDLSYADFSSLTSLASLFSNRTKLNDVNMVGANFSNITSLNALFSGCSNLVFVNMNNAIFGNKLANIQNIFYNCTKLNTVGFSCIDFSGVQNYITSMFNSCTNLYSVDMSSIKLSKATSLSGMFSDKTNLYHVNISHADISNVTNMSNMFHGCANLNNIAADDVSYAKVTTMKDMFSNCGNFIGFTSGGGQREYTIDADSCTDMTSMFSGCGLLSDIYMPKVINTSKVTTMEAMYQGCTSLTNFDISYLDATNVTKTINMFKGCTNLVNLNISNFKPSRVQDFTSMFQNCTNLKNFVGGLSNFDTSRGTDFESMFEGCSSLETLDISSFGHSYTSGTTTPFGRMFYGCSNLKTIYATSTFRIGSIAGINVAPNMFYGCTNIVGGNGTTYTSSRVDKDYAEIDGYNGNKGYFTGKPYNLYFVVESAAQGITDAMVTWTGTKPTKANYGVALTLPTSADVETYGYTLDGWYIDTTKYTKTDTSWTTDHTLRAGWKAKEYTIEYDLQGGSWNPTTYYNTDAAKTWKYDLGVSLPLSTSVKKEHYDFDGWYTESTGGTKYTEIPIKTGEINTSTGIKLYAHWKAKNYKLTFHRNSGEWISSQSDVIDWEYSATAESITIPDSTMIKRIGYDFDGWYNNPSLTGSKVTTYNKGMPTVDLYAKWIQHHYNIVYQGIGSEYNWAEDYTAPFEWTYSVEDSVRLPEAKDLVKENYIFEGWFDINDDSTRLYTVTRTRTEDITIKAKWKPVVYKVIFRNLTDDIVWTSGEVASVSWAYSTAGGYIDLPISADLQRPHYSFEGWHTSNSYSSSNKIDKIAVSTNKNLDVWINWIPDTYHVTYDFTNGGAFRGGYTAPTDWVYKTEGIANLPAAQNVIKDNYTFVGWYDELSGGNKYTSIQNSLDHNIVLYARWEAKTYRVSYVIDEYTHWYPSGYTPVTTWIYASTSITLPTSSNIIKNNYTFNGWYENSTFAGSKILKIESTKAPASGDTINLYPKWTGNTFYVEEYDLDGGQWNPQVYIPESSWVYNERGLTLPTNVSKTHYTFDGWKDKLSGEKIVSIDQNRDSNIRLIATWKANDYDIEYHLDGGHFVSTSSFPVSYTYLGPEKNIPSSYDDVKKDYYIFIGWFLDAACHDGPITKIETTGGIKINLYAKWEAEKYEIIYHENGGVWSTTYIKPEGWSYGDSGVTLPSSQITKAHYEFDGWYETSDFSTERVYTISGIRTLDIELYAKWKPCVYDIEYILGIDEYLAATASMPSKYTYLDTNIIIIPSGTSSVIKPNYTFVGWYDNEYLNEPKITTVNTNLGTKLVLYPKWQANTYRIIYHLDDGDFISSYKGNEPKTWVYSESGGEIILPTGLNMAKNHYHFDGWFSDDTFDESKRIVSILKSNGGDYDVYAKWLPDEYNIIYDERGGSYYGGYIKPLTWTYNPISTNSTLLPISTDIYKDNYNFGGWFTDPNCIDGNILDVPLNRGQDINVYAKWNPKEYDIIYKVAPTGKESQVNYWLEGYVAPTKFKYGVEDVNLPLGRYIERPHYTFDAWYSDESFDTDKKIIKVSCLSTDSVTVYANWLPDTYHITYEFSGKGSFAANYVASTSWIYDEDSSDFILLATAANIYSKNYEFVGWYTDQQMITGYTEVVPYSRDSDIKLYARFIPKEYCINYILGPGESFVDFEHVVKNWSYGISDAILPTTNDLIKDNYIFSGWYKNVELTDGPIDRVDKLTEGNIDLYPRWTPKTYTVTYNLGVGARWEPITYVPENTWVYASTSLTLPTSEKIYKEYYNFSGWYIDPNFTGSPSVIIESTRSGDTDIYAKWNPEVFKINYHGNGGLFVNGTDSVVRNWAYDVSDTPLPTGDDIKREHYTFAGWYEDEAMVASPCEIISKSRVGDIDIYAKWEERIYNISYVLGSNTYFEDSYTPPNNWRSTGDDVDLTTAINKIRRNNYEFIGFYDNSSYFGDQYTSISHTRTEDIILFAKWEAKKYYVTYDGEGTNYQFKSGFTVPRMWQYASTSIILPTKESIVNDYYTFINWEDIDHNIITNIDKMRDNDITLYPIWEANNYKATFVLNGGDWTVASTSITDAWTYGGIDLILPTSDKLSKPHSSFAGWFDNPNFINASMSIVPNTRNSDITLYAKWSEDKYSIRYDLNQGTWADGYTAPSDWTYKESEVIYLPSSVNIKRMDHAFNGWKDIDTGDVVTYVDRERENDIRIIALWTAVDKTITFDLSPNGEFPPGLVPPVGWAGDTPGEPIPLPTENEVREGTGSNSSFTGWYDEDGNGPYTEIPTDATKSIILHPVWIENDHEIDFGLDGYDDIEWSSDYFPPTGWYSTRSDLVPLPDETIISRPGYTFEGWYYEEPEGSGNMHGPIEYIDPSDPHPANGKLIPNWKSIHHEMSFVTSQDWHFVSTDSIVKNWDYSKDSSEKIVLPKDEDVVKDGYKLDGFLYKASGSDTWLGPITEISLNRHDDIILKPNFIILTFTIIYEKDGGEFVSPYVPIITYQYSETGEILLATSGEIKKDHHQFKGWYDNISRTGSPITSISKSVTHDITLYAYFELDKYYITYVLGTGTEWASGYTAPTEWYYGLSDITLPLGTNLRKPHYTFTGWFDEDAGGILYATISSTRTSDITVTARFEANTYNITYRDGYNTFNNWKPDYVAPDGWVYNPSGGEVSGFPTADNVEKSNYVFDGWYDNISLTGGKITNITRDRGDHITLYAKWKPAVYEINYIGLGIDFEWADGYVTAPTEFVYNEKDITLPKENNVKKTHYKFVGWFDSSYTEKYVIIPKDRPSSINLYPLWVGETYSVNYQLNGGEWNPSTYVPETTWIYASTSIILPTSSNIKKNYYVFDGWSLLNTTDIIYEIDKMTGNNVNIIANWHGETYTITYNLGEGESFVSTDSCITIYQYESGDNINLPDSSDIIKDNYTFDHWVNQYGDIVSSINTNICHEDIVLTPIWGAKTYSVTYELNGDLVNPVICTPSTYILPTTWIYASTSIILPTSENIMRNNYTFEGWYYSSSFTDSPITVIDMMTTENKTVYAKWKPLTYNINYHLDSGHFVSTSSVADSWVYNDYDIILVNQNGVIKDNYTFAGWYTDVDFTNSILVIPKDREMDIDLYAKWDAKTYSVTYELNGDLVNPVICTPSTYILPTTWIYASTSIILPTSENIKRNNYTFEGWYYSSSFTDSPITVIDMMTTENKTVYAKWQANSLNITYHMNGGEFVATDSMPHKWTYNYRDVTLPKNTVDKINIIKDNYTFAGWYTDIGLTESILVIPKDREMDIDLYAKWDAKTYNVTYELNSGEWNPSTYIPESTWVYGETSVTLPTYTNIKRDHYRFVGWCTDPFLTSATISEIDKYESGDTNVYAKWEALLYNIDFILYDGNFKATDSIITSWIYLDSDISLPDANKVEKNHYTFGGWFDNASLTGDPLLKINKERGEDITLHAKWIPDVYKVIYNLDNGHFVSTESVVYTWTYGVSGVTLPIQVEKEHYTFDGWFDAPKMPIMLSLPNVITNIDKYEGADKNVYAHFTPITYNITYHFASDEGFVSTYAGHEPLSWDYGVSDITLPGISEVEKPHYSFEGWYDNQDYLGTKYTSISKNRGVNIDLYPKFTPLTYHIYYHEYGGTWDPSYTKPESFTYKLDDVTLPIEGNISRDHYSFGGWYDNENYTGGVYTYVSKDTGNDVNMHAKWIPDVYDINYVFNDYRATWSEGYIAPNKWTYNENSLDVVSLPILGDIKNKDYTFAGWYTDSGLTGNPITKVDISRGESITIYAKWIPNTYTIEYDLNDGQWLKGGYKTSWTFERVGATLPDDTYLKKDHYTFAGWYDNSGLTGDRIYAVGIDKSGEDLGSQIKIIC